MGRFHQSAQASRPHGEQALRDLDVMGGADKVGRNGGVARPSLPAPHDLLDTEDVAALLFPKSRSPRQSVCNWIRRYAIPVKHVGGRIRVTGIAIHDHLNRKQQPRRRLRAVNS